MAVLTIDFQLKTLDRVINGEELFIYKFKNVIEESLLFWEKSELAIWYS